MTIALELSAEAEAKLQESIARNDAEGVRKVLLDAAALKTEVLLRASSKRMSAEEFESAAERLADEFEKNLAPNASALSNRAISRAEIYEDHP